MKTIIHKLALDSAPGNNAFIADAARILQSGGLVAFPTETVYGLGAIYSDDHALRRIFTVKGRPGDNPLILHIWRMEQLSELVREISPVVRELAEKFWPGPLTLVLPKQPGVSWVATAGLDTVAIRMPSHPVAQMLLRLTDIPVAAPSANLSGRPSPTTGEHVTEDLDGKVEMILDAGPSSTGIESTVLTLSSDEPVILRPGSVTGEMLARVLGRTVFYTDSDKTERPQAPGMKYRHYAPLAPVILVEGERQKVVREINRLWHVYREQGKTKIIILGVRESLSEYYGEWVLDLGSGTDPVEIASCLYDRLRQCDRMDADQILIEGIPHVGVGVAILNRLRKAAGGNVVYVS